MIYNYQKLPYYNSYNYVINYIKKNMFANNDYIYYLLSIVISIVSITIAIIYIIKFAENINKKI
jgi:hypothetical protein